MPPRPASPYAGCAGGPCIDFGGVSQVNLEGASSGGAELIAILEALIWGGALRKQVIFIHFDCIPIGNFVFGLCFSVQEDLRPLATLTRALLFFLRERGAKIVGRHIYGHD